MALPQSAVTKRKTRSEPVICTRTRRAPRFQRPSGHALFGAPSTASDNRTEVMQNPSCWTHTRTQSQHTVGPVERSLFERFQLRRLRNPTAPGVTHVFDRVRVHKRP
eukprot:7153398-Prymnesium_polylepis.1